MGRRFLQPLLAEADREKKITILFIGLYLLAQALCQQSLGRVLRGTFKPITCQLLRMEADLSLQLIHSPQVA